MGGELLSFDKLGKIFENLKIKVGVVEINAFPIKLFYSAKISLTINFKMLLFLFF